MLWYTLLMTFTKQRAVKRMTFGVLLAFLSVHAMPSMAIGAGPVNGPSVADLQGIVNAVCSGQPGPAHRDVNGDGEVNILDFHASLAASQDVQPVDDWPQVPFLSERCSVADQLRRAPVFSGVLMHGHTSLETEAEPSVPSPYSHSPGLIPTNQRYLFVLTPNAPPFI
jgi:hypothetical protein